jgi:hypothetical protein
VPRLNLVAIDYSPSISRERGAVNAVRATGDRDVSRGIDTCNRYGSAGDLSRDINA